MTTPAAAPGLSQALSLLGQKRFADAEAICRKLLHGSPRNAEALHLLGLVLKDAGDAAEGERLIGQSIAIEPHRAEFRVNLANLLRRQGRLQEAVASYRTALEFERGHRLARLGLARVLNDLGEHAEAEKESRVLLAANERDAQAWVVLGAALREQNRIGESETAYRRATFIEPDYGVAHHNLGALLSRAHRAEEALVELERAGALGVGTATLAENLARTMLQLYRMDDAERAYATAVRLEPRNIDAQLSLAQLRHMRGDPAFARDLLSARSMYSNDARLDLLFADVLRRTGDLPASENLLRDMMGRGGPSPEVAAALAQVLQEQGRLQEAELHALEAAALKPHETPIVETLVAIQLARGHVHEARPFIQAMRARLPREQRWIAYEATAARLAGEALYQDLYDYERLVRIYEIEPPRGWSSLAQLNADVMRVLQSRHQFVSHPLDQSLRNGSQTARSLLSDPDPTIRALLGAFEEPVRRYRQAIGTDPTHPLSSRNHGEARMRGCWSVQLRREGFHVNHLHPEGWISSAYYVSVPEETSDMSLASGWLKFGETRFPVPGASAARFVQPHPGRLVLFPSYMWHGTTPIHGTEPRTTVAFDVVPDGE